MLMNASTIAATISQGGEVVLPSGELVFTATPQDRSIPITQDTYLRSAGETVIKLGPDSQGGPGWDSPNYPWSLFSVAPVSCEFRIGQGITLLAPNIDPALYPLQTAAMPDAIAVEGSNVPGVRRVIDIRGLRLRGPWNNGVICHGDNSHHQDPAPSGIFTDLRLNDDCDIETAGNGVAAFGQNKRIWIDGFRANCGWFYVDANGDYVNGYGNAVYVDQGSELNLCNFDLTTAYGRDAIKYAGVRSEGGGGGSIHHGIVRSGLHGFGTGIGLDKWALTSVEGVTFDASLYAALQLFGQADIRGGKVLCPTFIQPAGTGSAPSSGPQAVNVAGTRFDGCRSLVAHGMDRGRFNFRGITVIGVEDPDAILFELAGPWSSGCKVRVSDSQIDATLCNMVFNNTGGDWEIVDTDLTANARRGIFGFGCPEGASMRVKGGTRSGASFYHSANQADVDRVVFSS